MQIGKFFSLNLNDKLLVLRSWLDILWVIVLIRTALRTSLFRNPETTSLKEFDPSEIKHLTYLFDMAASHHIKNLTCLERSIALGRLLAHKGLETKLRIGVEKNGSILDAHAWIESPYEIPGNETKGYEPLRHIEITSNK